MNLEKTMTAFLKARKIGEGPVRQMLRAVKARVGDDADSGNVPEGPLLIFDDRTGTQVDFDLRGTESDVLAALEVHPFFVSAPKAASKGMVGRPKLGVKAREVTLLPRHWEWLGKQPSGASATLRRLVDAAIARPSPEERARTARDAAGKVMWCLAGDLPGFEEASRALYKGEIDAFEARIADWPPDIRDYLARLARGEAV